METLGVGYQLSVIGAKDVTGQRFAGANFTAALARANFTAGRGRAREGGRAPIGEFREAVSFMIRLGKPATRFGENRGSQVRWTAELS
jgi:hypothetical protein